MEKKTVDAIDYYNERKGAESYFFSSILGNGCMSAKIISEMVTEKFPELIRPKGGLLVDLGCGPGFSFIKVLKKMTFNEIIAVDGSSEMLSFVNSRSLSGNLKLSTQIADLRINNINVESASADMIISCYTMSYLSTLEKVFSESGRILKSGGLFCFDLLNHNQQHQSMLLVDDKDFKINHYIHPLFKILYLARKSGLDLIFKCRIDCDVKDSDFSVFFFRKR